MTPTTNLANAARRLCAARAGEGFDTLEHELSKALDDYDAQEILKIDLRSRVTDRQLAEMFIEEWKRVTAEAPEVDIGDKVNQAYLQAARRIANYADHLRGLILLFAGNINFAFLLRDQAVSETGDGTADYNAPRIKRLAVALAGMLGEAELNLARPADNSATPVDKPADRA